MNSSRNFSEAIEIPSWIYGLRLIPTWFKGKARLAQFLAARVLPNSSSRIEAYGLTFVVPSPHEPIARGLIADGCYEPRLCEAIRRTTQPTSVVFDVGANVGAIAILAAHKWCTAGKVVAFEASPVIYEFLRWNELQNLSPVLHTENYAVGECSGDELIFYEAPSTKFGMGSLANRFGVGGVNVPTLSLDCALLKHQCERVDVIKIDVEGFEVAVLKGARKILSQDIAPVIFFEFNDWAENRPNEGVRPGDAQRFLLSLGYKLQTLEGFLKGLKPGSNVIISGGAELVATRGR